MKKLVLSGVSLMGVAWAQFVAYETATAPPPSPSVQAQVQAQAKSTEQQFADMLKQVQAIAQSDEMKQLVASGKALGHQVQTDLKRDASQVLVNVANAAAQFSQQVSPDHVPNGAVQNVPIAIDPNLQGIAYVKQLPHGSLVQLQGNIEAKVAGEHPYKYWFADGRDKVVVEIEPEVWRNQKVSPKTLITIWAEVERVRTTNKFKELEVDYLEITK